MPKKAKPRKLTASRVSYSQLNASRAMNGPDTTTTSKTTLSDRIDRHLKGERVVTEYINLQTGESARPRKTKCGERGIPQQRQRGGALPPLPQADVAESNLDLL